jgi:hypothetical protein
MLPTAIYACRLDKIKNTGNTLEENGQLKFFELDLKSENIMQQRPSRSGVAEDCGLKSVACMVMARKRR